MRVNGVARGSAFVGSSQRPAAPVPAGADPPGSGSPIWSWPTAARLACEELIEEQHRASVLRAHSLEPRHRILLVGPPGNGKTSLAEAIAEALSAPFFVVRYEALIGSFLGENRVTPSSACSTTPGRRRAFCSSTSSTPVGKERGDVHETGEIKRVVSSLLMQVDDLPSYTVVVAATNHAELLDRAVLAALSGAPGTQSPHTPGSHRVPSPVSPSLLMDRWGVHPPQSRGVSEPSAMPKPKSSVATCAGAPCWQRARRRSP